MFGRMGGGVGIAVATVTAPYVAPVEGGGGGGVTPILSLDFKNGVYSLNGASRAVTELVESNTVAGGAFSTDNIISGQGLKSDVTGTGEDFSNRLLLTTEAAADLLMGFVAVASVVLDATAPDYYNYASLFIQLNDPGDFNTDWDFAVTVEDNGTEKLVSAQIEDYWNEYSRDNGVPLASVYKMAGRMDATAIQVSVNGRAVTSTVDAPQANTSSHVCLTLNAIVVAASGSATATLEKVEFFALADYAFSDLTTLSA